MKTIFACQELPRSIFLAGPTPRNNEIESWRQEALAILEELNFDGYVFVPEADNWLQKKNYDNQVAWEWDALNRSSTIVFWVPRELKYMPAFTTNVEFGMMVSTHKCVLGYPKDAPKCGYLKELAERYGSQVFHDLREMLEFVLT